VLVLHSSLTPVSIVTFAGGAVDVPGGSVSDGELLQQWERNGGPPQLWYLDPCGAEMYRIVNRGSGRVVDITMGGDAGTRLQQFAWAANDNQRWGVADAGGGLVVVHSISRPDLVIDVGGASRDNGAEIIVWHRNGQHNQSFRLV
jgi:hypothetical protein